MRRFPPTRVFLEVDQPHELYRRKLRVMLWRLERTAAGDERVAQGGIHLYLVCHVWWNYFTPFILGVIRC